VAFTVFDVETRIDKALLNTTLYRRDGLSDDEAFARTQEELAARGSGFFPLAFHVPVAIVVGEVGDDRILTGVHALGAPAFAEAGIVRDFWDRLEREGDALVSFNGRSFDLPVLELAALRHGCRIPRYFAAGYRDQDADGPHYDVYDFLTNQGAHGLRGGFQLVTRLIGLPGKGPTAGGDVQALWEAGRLADIVAYCRRDVIQTYFVFLRLELIRGRISSDQYQAAVAVTAPFRQELG
jgi:predicted PolB exonuclease-like 3'-5' exonuclease